MDDSGYVKNLGQVAALVISRIAPSIIYVLWYDLNTSTVKYYNKTVGDWVPLASPVVGAENLLSTGEGLIFKDLQDSVLEFRRIKAGKGISVSTGDTDITIETKDFLESSSYSLSLDSIIDSTLLFRISSNISWQLIIPTTSWIEFDKVEGYGYAEVTITVLAENPTTDPRNVTILLRDVSGVLDDKEILITQNGSSVFVSKYIQNSGDFQCELR